MITNFVTFQSGSFNTQVPCQLKSTCFCLPTIGMLYLSLLFDFILTLRRGAIETPTTMASIRQLQRLPLPLLDSISCRSVTQTCSFALSCRRRATVSLSALDSTKGDRERIVVLGSGWAGVLPFLRMLNAYPVLTAPHRLRSLPATVIQIPSARRLSSLLLRLHPVTQLYRRWHPRISQRP